MGTLLSPEKHGTTPTQFLAHVYCGQTDGWIKMTLGMEVGLSPGHIVLVGDPAPPTQKGGRGPNFRPISIVAKLLDASTCHFVWSRYQRMPYCARRGPSSPPQKGTAPLSFRPMSIVAKGLE